MNVPIIYYYPDCETMTDVAYYYIDELQALGDIPPSLQNYIDYEAYGRDLDMGGCISYSYWLFIQPVCVVSNCKLTGYSKNSLYFFEFRFYWTIDNLFFNYLCFGFA